MKITVIGPGALGCLVAASLVKSGEDVWLLDKAQERARKINKDGIKVEGTGEFSAKVRATCDAKDIGVSDLVVVCVKSYDTEDAIKEAKAVIGDNTLVLTLQNGLGNEEAIAEIIGQEKVIGGVTMHGSTYLADGRIRHSGKGETIIGRWYTPAPRKDVKKWYIPRRRLEEVAAVLKKANFETKISDSIKDVIWSKLIINTGINALGAITRLKNGDLFQYEWTRNIMKQAVMEAVKVAKRRRVNLQYTDPVKKIESVCSACGNNICSMLQDVLDGQGTEIDYINGAIAAEGAGLGIATPVNSVLTDLVKTLEESGKKQINKE
ncbi:MAG TPA: 2-dehydropantoate 2-reductase [Candidatus Omnitrophota bacterium]|nr:2-dehydropantoate 2-reductase [Candidatus Omnitrophota bacterium]HOX10091.1 2-dehydropantoate 2-reductase [Candidatus Omnitrophota bacterium]HRZ66718.1 2-dehydropantoate 2-reductase [Candidatus Omnitrophota bacterium]